MSWGAHVGDGRGGMAAEGREPFQNPMYARRTSLGGRIGRGRLRTLPQHLVISESAHDTTPEIRTAPPPWSGTDRYGKVTFNKNVFSGATINEDNGGSSDATDTDSDTETGTLVPPATGTTAAFDPEPHGLQLSDFSNHLGDSMDIDDPDPGSVTKVGSDADAFRRMSPDEDLYGWDAVLHHKTTHPFGDPSNPYQHRLASRSKRNLLHRVFSTGGTGPRETPSSPPTSSTWTDSTM
ncbi:hypothetical protein VM1G_09238 [Cytospora mali]|uniref:Uncharacterized protein n=1 Tax=Cytospora mali TaxID=578113 RepID=A0A194WBY3_CYTMA|nr:hypothetical protein VM1G_09238 [Valsa mali]